MAPARRIVVMMGGPSSEHEVSLASGRAVTAALQSLGHDVSALVVGRDGAWRMLSPTALPALEPKPQASLPSVADRGAVAKGMTELKGADAVFLAFHGPFGEDGSIQGLLKTLGIPYTGSGPLASALAMHKSKAKELYQFHGLQVPRSITLDRSEWRRDPKAATARVLDAAGLPLVVKPNQGGSSIGARAVAGEADLADALAEGFRHDTAVLVEERLIGTELTCAILEEPDGSLRPLPVIEIASRHDGFFDFEEKYQGAEAVEIVPARVPPAVQAAAQEVAKTAHRALMCEGFSRTDLFWTDRGPVVLETNTIPGLTPQSLVPRAAQAAGISFADLLDRLVDLAIRRAEREAR
jgi:D-alanine-D-alanine ligase